MPVVGKAAAIFETVCKLHPQMTFKRPSLDQLLAGKRVVNKWKRLEQMPPRAELVANGASLTTVNEQLPPPPPPLPQHIVEHLAMMAAMSDETTRPSGHISSRSGRLQVPLGPIEPRAPGATAHL